MVTRTKRVTWTFQHPFSLKGVDRRLAAGQYEVVTDEELIEELSFPVYRRVATLIFLPADAYQQSSIEMVNVVRLSPSKTFRCRDHDRHSRRNRTPLPKRQAPISIPRTSPASR